MSSSAEKSKSASSIFGIILMSSLEPIIFFASITISCAILLHGIGADFTDIFSFVNLVNSKTALSDAFAVFIPVGILSILTILVSFTRLRATRDHRLLGPIYYFIQIILSIILCTLTVFNSIEFASAFGLDSPLAADSVWRMKLLLGATLIASTCAVAMCKFDEGLHSIFAQKALIDNSRK